MGLPGPVTTSRPLRLCRRDPMAFEIDTATLEELYRAQARGLLVYFTRRCYDAQLAVDLVGETFARAFARRRRFRGASVVEAEAWLWAIARNALRDALRRGRVEREALRRLGVQTPQLAEDEIARVEQLAGVSDLRTAIAQALDALGPAQREALRLRVVLELDYPAVAERLGVSQQTARARVSRALRALSTTLELAEARP